MKIRQILGIILLAIGAIGLYFAFWSLPPAREYRSSSVWEIFFLIVAVAWFFFSVIVKLAMVFAKQMSRGFQEIGGASLFCYLLMIVFGALSAKGTIHVGLSSNTEFIIWIWTISWVAADVFYLPFIQKSLRSPTDLP